MNMAIVGAKRYIAATGIGFTAGFTLGLCGWGGAQVIKPALTSGYMGLSQLSASGCSLTSLSGAATVGATKFYMDDQVDLKRAISIAVPSMFGVRMGLRMAQKMSSELQALIFNGMSVILIPSYFLIQQRALKNDETETGINEERTNEGVSSLSSSASSSFLVSTDYISLAKNSVFGGCLGMLTSIMGVGGVPLVMSYLTLTSDCPHHLIQGTAMAACLPPVLISALSLGFSGHTPLALAASVALGSMAGSFGGAHFALHLSENQTHKV